MDNMKLILSTVSILTLGVVFTFVQPLNSQDRRMTWTSSFKIYRNHFKVLSPSQMKHCEALLADFLTALDTKNQCTDDGHCVLINQSPFGNTIPVPSTLSETMKAKAREYGERCDDGDIHFVTDEQLVYYPVCQNGKCMVKTTFKEQGSR